MDIDFKSLPFAYHKIDYRYVSRYIDGKWDEGTLSKDENIVLNESACVLQYAQQVFEGLKAYTTVDGRKVLFRPDLNAERFYHSAEVMQMAPVDKDKFINACLSVASANKDYIPPYESGASLYLRPFEFGLTPLLGVKPASEFEFRVFGSPVGPYFKGDAKQLSLTIPDLDRAAPHGTGNIKAGLNYAMSMRPYVEAHKNGFDENLYLDSGSRTYIEETGGANVLFVDKDGTVVTPKSDSILPSITRRSLLYVAEHYLGLKAVERKITAEELDSFVECGLCGTAAVISPVGKITNKDKVIEYKTGPIIDKLRETLLGIQKGKIEAPDGWIYEIK